MQALLATTTAQSAARFSPEGFLLVDNARSRRRGYGFGYGFGYGNGNGNGNGNR